MSLYKHLLAGGLNPHGDCIPSESKILELPTERRQKADTLADHLAGILVPRIHTPQTRKLARELKRCGKSLVVASCPDGHHAHVEGIERCHHRACPVCAGIRAHELAAGAGEVWNRLSASGDYSLVHIVLTVPNTDRLKPGIDGLLRAWRLLRQRKRWKGAIVGGIRSLEVTQGRDGRWHPHLHVLALVHRSYFRAGNLAYIPQAELAEMWRACCGLVDTPVVWVASVRDAEANTAIREVCKYICKPGDLLEMGLDETEELLTATSSRRMVEPWGLWRQVAREIGLDEEGGREDADLDVCPVCGAMLARVLHRWDSDAGRYAPDHGYNCEAERRGPPDVGREAT